MPIPRAIYVPSTSTAALKTEGDSSASSPTKEKLVGRLASLSKSLMLIAKQKAIIMQDDDSLSDMSMRSGRRGEGTSEVDSFLEIIQEHKRFAAARRDTRVAYAA